uniref:Sulfotransferase domain-containing protein n=1 Tax=Alexandrium catenella TaxID=2925 RepID=A0A7S1L7T5_ALECA|mmetsp:Transcript_108080/g.287767  ORF Transcript_108080/g.287767 Transcript_108080/m.287767 type:complete len:456 (+) Transcript_108080:37-1404(+)
MAPPAIRTTLLGVAGALLGEAVLLSHKDGSPLRMSSSAVSQGAFLGGAVRFEHDERSQLSTSVFAATQALRLGGQPDPGDDRDFHHKVRKVDDRFDISEATEEPPIKLPGITDSMRKLDADIYARHWGPLKPPPYHHPEYYPDWDQFQELESLEQGYTDYWRSLPMYPEVSKLLEVSQRAPYLKFRNWTKLAPRLPMTPEDERHVSENLAFTFHHKTGVTMVSNIRKILPKKHFNLSLIHEPALRGPQVWPRHVKTVHFVRDPIETIISSYRYHQNRWGSETWSWGQFKLQDPMCYNCDDEDHKVIFDTCDFNCTYYELLNRVNETTGVTLEAVSARETLTRMAVFMAFQEDNPYTLQLSLNLWHTDTDKTARCLSKFLGYEGDAVMERKIRKAAKDVNDPYHITRGRYDNTHLRSFLLNHPVWGPDFRAVHEYMAGIFRRQAQMYGCPDQEMEW